MADRTASNVDDASVFVSNTSETSEITCACCDKLKIELQKTLEELKSAQKIVELLQEEVNLKTPTRIVDACNLHHTENSTQSERKNRNWVHVPSSRRKREKKSEEIYTQPIPTIVNRYELLNHLKQPTNITLNQRLEFKQKNEDRKIKTMVRRKQSSHHW
jgi:hypothetical protein